ncbi:hypothetical protein GYMLUDRAFT_353746 [Collybiopsis luxurians FD-317 M1]|nr:hypothetical protein GYMLUDRAFT_353746 [Collybiopsis luxurians FD-317 M1]
MEFHAWIFNRLPKSSGWRKARQLRAVRHSSPLLVLSIRRLNGVTSLLLCRGGSQILCCKNWKVLQDHGDEISPQTGRSVVRYKTWRFWLSRMPPVDPPSLLQHSPRR